MADNNQVIQIASFKMANEEYGVDVLRVREIIRVPAITRVPNAGRNIQGVINLRGKVIPIISIRGRFNIPESEYNNSTRIIVMDIGGDMLGFVVDEVSEVLRIDGAEIQPAPELATSNIARDLISGIVQRKDRLLLLLDMDKFFSSECESLNI